MTETNDNRAMSVREKAKQSKERVRLIQGRPGVGKTWFGCEIADYELSGFSPREIQSFQEILFLTFARNAVYRIRETYLKQSAQQNVERNGKGEPFNKRIRIDTFAGFFWWLVESYGRYTPSGSTKRSWLLGKNEIGHEFVPGGYRGYTFDMIEKSALALLQIDSIQHLICELYPLIIIDEFQDVRYRLFDIIALLANKSRLVLLRGPGQCIYRKLFKFDPEKVLQKCRTTLKPDEFSIGPKSAQKQRHCPEIQNLIFQYKNGNVSASKDWPIRFVAVPRLNRKRILAICAGLALQNMRPHLQQTISGNERPTIAILASTNQAAAVIHDTLEKGHASLKVGTKPYRLRPWHALLLFNDHILLHYGRLLLQLLQMHWIAKKKVSTNEQHIAVAIASLFQEVDERIEESSHSWFALAHDLIAKVNRFKPPNAQTSWRDKLKTDLDTVNRRLRATKGAKTNKLPQGCPSTPFTRGDIPFLDTLSKEFRKYIESSVDVSGQLDLTKAKLAFETSARQRILYEKLGFKKSTQVMTIHKAKGREFDGVVLVLEENGRELWTQSNNEELDDLYRVAISRPKNAFALVAFKDAYQKAAPVVQKLLPKELFPIA